jgi:hypothetical protein
MSLVSNPRIITQVLRLVCRCPAMEITANELWCHTGSLGSQCYLAILADNEEAQETRSFCLGKSLGRKMNSIIKEKQYFFPDGAWRLSRTWFAQTLVLFTAGAGQLERVTGFSRVQQTKNFAWSR